MALEALAGSLVKAGLGDAIALRRTIRDETPRTTRPRDWAATQNNRGTALARLGERRRDVGLLHEALAAVRAAREVLVREAGQAHLAVDFEQRIAAIEAAIRDLSTGD